MARRLARLGGLMDCPAGGSWNAPETVAGFAQSAPNAVLLRFAEAELRRRGGTGRALDLGCGAARNSIPLIGLGWDVVGIDLSRPMLSAAAQRARQGPLEHQLHLVVAPMDQVPLRSQTFDLVIAHGIWNLARSAAEFRRAVGEAARVARPGAALFVFTFSRSTFPAETMPVPGEPFVFTQFSGQPQCFLTGRQLVEELGAAGFVRDPGVPLTEYNAPKPTTLPGKSTPAIHEAAFRLVEAPTVDTRGS
ncbi:MAG TPA: class I SAM-dependent methyltransferase [Methylomirabilota bacterium]|nr:class I SAM-dependent methyltransferase [Methylomirabilota bacterium]